VHSSSFECIQVHSSAFEWVDSKACRLPIQSLREDAQASQCLKRRSLKSEESEAVECLALLSTRMHLTKA
jgi:hypothetical protein